MLVHVFIEKSCLTTTNLKVKSLVKFEGIKSTWCC